MWNRSYVLLAGVLLPSAFAAAQSYTHQIELYRQAATRVAEASAMSVGKANIINEMVITPLSCFNRCRVPDILLMRSFPVKIPPPKRILPI